MRHAVLLALLAGGCAPEVVGGAYYCGPEELCPDDLTCDGVTNICVSQRDSNPFACGDITEHEPNNSAATAESIGNVECTTRVEAMGCVQTAGDAEDNFGFVVPANCQPRKVVAKAAFPVAYEPMVIELVNEAGTVVGTSEPCSTGATDENGVTGACLDAPVDASGTYAVRLTGAGSDNCDGACAYNRYGLTIQLTSQ